MVTQPISNEASIDLDALIRERDDLRIERDSLAAASDNVQQPWVAYEPALVPHHNLMLDEGVHVLEEWYRWAEEWQMLLRIYGGLTRKSKVMEIGCGTGRTAFPLRFILSPDGSYDGFDISPKKVSFLEESFHRAYPNFRFVLSDVHNHSYNPEGAIKAESFLFPYQNAAFDIVYAASVFTHMLPDAAKNYFQQAARVLKPEGRCVFSFFIFDNYQPDQERPLGFANPAFNFDYSFADYGDKFAIAEPDVPDQMTAYSVEFIEEIAEQAGLKFAQAPLPGFWSGSHECWVGTQDIVILEKVK
ncbi:MAG: class I SAM-dependent methyltransferase [Chloroflexota bacterium]